MTRVGYRRAFAATAAVVAAAALAGAVAGQNRDRSGGPAGTAVIAGLVQTDAELSVPLRRAVITVTGGGLDSSRSAISDDSGRFAIGGLPGGRYTVTAAKAAYLQSAYGARRPGRPGTALVLADGERREVAIRLARGAVVEGVIRDDDGRPLAGVDVYVLNPKAPASVGMAMTARRDQSTTDDRGVYRVFGLAPGEYVIAASVAVAGDGDVGRRRDDEVDALLEAVRRRGPVTPPSPPPVPPPAPAVGFPLTYYPGVPVFANAIRVRLSPGEERVGLDFPFAPVPVATVEGVVARADGQPVTGVQLSLDLDGPAVFVSGGRPILSTPPGPDGRFKYSSMAPGHYRVYARVGRPASAVPGTGGGVPATPPTAVPAAPLLFAVAEFDVAGQDLTGLSLLLQPGVTVRGRTAFDRASTAQPDLSGLRLRLTARGRLGYSANYGGTSMGAAIVNVPPATLAADGSFEIRSVAPGTYGLTVTVPPDISERWWLRSAMFEGRDLLDAPVEIGTSDISGVVLTLTDKRAELAGTLESAAGTPAPDYFVVLFPADRSLWLPGSRRVASARPDTTGAFSLRDVPGGAYLVAALTDVEPADLEDPAFLEGMAAQAVPVTLVEGQRTVQDLRIAR